jgi:hypothetical protein
VFLLITPPLTWGMMRFGLNALEGRGRVSDLFTGARAPVLSIYGLILSLLLITLPCYVPSLAAAGQADAIVIVAAQLVAALWSVFVGLRVYFAWMFLVDRRQGVLESISSSWAATRGKLLGLVGLMTASMLVGVAGFFVLIIGVIPAQLMVILMWMSAYRQITGRSDLTAAHAA